MTEVPAMVIPYNGLHKNIYRQSSFRCELPNDHTPISVSLVTERAKTPTNLIPIKEIRNISYEVNFTVCLKPLSRHYDRAYELVEWIELCRILGAEMFVIYNYSSEANIAAVLDVYTDESIVEVVQWPIPMVDDIHEYGTVASLNDCLYRSREKSKYLVVLDTDEFIIPHSEKSKRWNDLMDELPKHKGYHIRNVFFRKEWQDTNKRYFRREIAERLRLATLLKTKREKYVWNRQRSKYIVNTSAAITLGNHHITNMIEDKKDILEVNTEIGYLHHYRNKDEPRLKDEHLIL